MPRHKGTDRDWKQACENIKKKHTIVNVQLRLGELVVAARWQWAKGKTLNWDGLHWDGDCGSHEEDS